MAAGDPDSTRRADRKIKCRAEIHRISRIELWALKAPYQIMDRSDELNSKASGASRFVLIFTLLPISAVSPALRNEANRLISTISVFILVRRNKGEFVKTCQQIFCGLYRINISKIVQLNYNFLAKERSNSLDLIRRQT